jgi:hypothetical protein
MESRNIAEEQTIIDHNVGNVASNNGNNVGCVAVTWRFPTVGRRIFPDEVECSDRTTFSNVCQTVRRHWVHDFTQVFCLEPEEFYRPSNLHGFDLYAHIRISSAISTYHCFEGSNEAMYYANLVEEMNQRTSIQHQNVPNIRNVISPTRL